MREQTIDTPGRPYSRRKFMRNVGVVAGGTALLSGSASAASNAQKNAFTQRGNCLLSVDTVSPKNHEFTLNIDNTYFPLPVGRKWTLQGTDPDGTIVGVETEVLDQTKTIAGVETRVVREKDFKNDRLIEVAHDYYAQTTDGIVAYFGESVDIYKNGKVTSHKGSWTAAQDNFAPGIFMPAELHIGDHFKQEVAPKVAEDRSVIVNLGETVKVPFDTFRNCLRAYDTDNLDPTAPGDTKVYAPNVGPIVDESATLVRYKKS